jgi:DNA polymerase-3 subunit alpha
MEWVSFHTHSTYSYGDGYGTVREHVQRVAALGMRALALSEHGNVNSHVALEKECKNAGINPIFGIEAYFGPVKEQSKTRSKCHIGLYAMDEEGYRNLSRIVSQSYIDSYQYPTVSQESLKKYNAGIAVLSGCSDSLISCTLLGGKFLGEKRESYSEDDWNRVRKRLGWFRSIFGERFYLEVQRFPTLDRSCTLNQAFAKLSVDMGIPLLATADVHYPSGSDNKMQEILHKSRRSNSISVADQAWEYDTLLTYPESDEEIQNDLIATGLSLPDAMRAIQNTKTLADACNVTLPKARPLRFPVPDNTNAQRLINKRIMQGWRLRIEQRPEIAAQWEDYKARIVEEYKVIKAKGFIDYFLAVSDLVKWAKENGIVVGPARGSAAASLICYLLGITEIDPLHPAFSRMVFERFIDPTRSDFPDIDLDFDDELRFLIADRAREIYGKENVANVGNHIGYRGRNSLDGVARAYGLPLATFKEIKERISDRTETDDRRNDTIADVLESYALDPAISVLCQTYPVELAQAVALEGNQHSMGIHAGGFVIASDPISEVCAIRTTEKGTGRNREFAQVIPYEKRDAEYLGMLKMDFLSLSAMGVLSRCLHWSGMRIPDLYSLFYKSWGTGVNHDIQEAFFDDDVAGIFQYEGATTRALMRRLGPATFDHIAAVGALSRPGPYYGGQADAYIAVKNGEKEIKKIHENFDKHVEWTYGQIVYQEQIMWILRDVAGFDVPTVLRVRKIIGKKLGEHQFRSLEDQFITGCEATSRLSEVSARAIWASITTAAGYAFNIAHAYSYALIAWWQMWFKIHEPSIFYAATLAKNGDGKDQLPRRVSLLQDAIRHEINIEPIHPVYSAGNWTPASSHSLRPGFRQIDGIGDATADTMIEWRKHRVGAFELVWDSYEAVPGIGPKTIAKIESFATQEDCFGIYKTERQLEEFRKQLNRGDFDFIGLPAEEEFVVSTGLPESDMVAFVGFVSNIIYRDDVESIRSRTGETVEQIKARIDQPEKTKKCTIFAYDELGELALRVSRFRFGALQTRIGKIKPDFHYVVVRGRTYERTSNAIQVSSMWLFDP